MLLVLTLFPAFASQGNALGLAGDIVEIQWGGHPTKARIDHCRSEGCDLYLWDTGSDGTRPGGTASTTVYPVSAQYTHRHAYRDAFLTFQQDEIYKCFKNAFGKRQCNPASGGKGTIKKFREERAG
jgi:hypothetical protein